MVQGKNSFSTDLLGNIQGGKKRTKKEKKKGSITDQRRHLSQKDLHVIHQDS